MGAVGAVGDRAVVVVPASAAGRPDLLGSLLPGALLAGVGSVVLSWAAGLLVPTVMERSLREFGPPGSVFTFPSWLIAVFLVAVSGLAIGQFIASCDWYRTASRRLTRVG